MSFFRRDRRDPASPEMAGSDSKTAEPAKAGFDPFAPVGSEQDGSTQEDAAPRPLMLELWLDGDNAEAVPYSEITRVSRHRDRLITLHCPSFMIEIEGKGLGALWDDLLAHRAELVRLTQGTPAVTAIKLIPLTGEAETE